MTVYEIDVTKHLKPGVNELALAVRSESLADMLGSLTQYAAHQLGGITRKVTLMAVPQTHVSDVRIVTDLDSEYRNAALKIETAVVNKATYAQNGLTLRLSVNGLPNVIEQRLPKLAVGEVWKGILSDTVAAPLLWNNEQPHLYTLRMELCLNDEVIETVEKRFGFREIEVRGNELFVNGRAVKLRGVCRHEMHPLTGRVVDAMWQRRILNFIVPPIVILSVLHIILLVRKCWISVMNWECLSK